jgi:hypothetical protein
MPNLYHFPIEEFFQYFTLPDFLLHSKFQIEIYQTTANSLSFLAEILDNPCLFSRREIVSLNH